MKGSYKYHQYCKLTCLGGTGLGECDCSNIRLCKFQNEPDFRTYYKEARERTLRIHRLKLKKIADAI